MFSSARALVYAPIAFREESLSQGKILLLVADESRRGEHDLFPRECPERALCGRRKIHLRGWDVVLRTVGN
jgi:hypothetical protein